MGAGGVVAVAAVVGVLAVGVAGGVEPDEMWRDRGLRVVDRATRADGECVSHSFGQVQELLRVVPCAGLERMIFTVTDDAGSTAVVFVAWVEFGDREAARRFKELEDVHGTGDITPLTGALVQVEDVPFTAHNYDSDVVDGVTVVIAEAENVVGGFTAEYLDDIAGIAVRTPRP
ncbi:hypothetical protein FHX81_2032 [Saccharothrix saharensis]|uniref:Uncharacterized protein n=1 Tax=Saccharothrix saharensis TaxID=571190 RepID=A0A543JA68_9PSEU|nr:hypothetical protein [Saccharothrix saharensis]TQM79722.1 hypothetical protein FHX81_2032 [Saccharothrix saharensis]